MVYPDTQAVFTCEYISGLVSAWYINGTRSDSLPEELRSDINILDVGDFETLTITTRTQYNNTVIQCHVGRLGGNGYERTADNVTLTIQGT